MKLDFKLQHYASLALPIAGLVISEILAANSSGSLALSAHVLQAPIVAGKIQSLLTVSIDPAANARAALATGAVVPASIAQGPRFPTPTDSSTEVTQPDASVPRKP